MANLPPIHRSAHPDPSPEPEYVQQLRAELELALTRACLAEDILRPLVALAQMWARRDSDLLGEPWHYRYGDCTAPNADYCRRNHNATLPDARGVAGDSQ